jgi:hypothetical protein
MALLYRSSVLFIHYFFGVLLDRSSGSPGTIQLLVRKKDMLVVPYTNNDIRLRQVYFIKIWIVQKMDKNALKIIKEIEEVINEITIRISTPRKGGHEEWNLYVTSVATLHTKISAIFYRYTPRDSPYFQKSLPLLEECQTRTNQGYETIDELAHLRGILEALKEAYSYGYFTTVNELITADLFSDFLEMAENFLSQGDLYKHPAAFLIGGVLEEHLRKLAVKNEISITKDNGKFRHAEDINVDLRKKGVYSENEKQSISAWLSLRNDVDHAHWEKITSEKVDIMLKDIRRIINQYPA